MDNFIIPVGADASSLRNGSGKDRVPQQSADPLRSQARAQRPQRPPALLLLHEQVRHTTPQGRGGDLLEENKEKKIVESSEE